MATIIRCTYCGSAQELRNRDNPIIIRHDQPFAQARDSAKWADMLGNIETLRELGFNHAAEALELLAGLKYEQIKIEDSSKQLSLPQV